MEKGSARVAADYCTKYVDAALFSEWHGIMCFPFTRFAHLQQHTDGHGSNSTRHGGDPASFGRGLLKIHIAHLIIE